MYASGAGELATRLHFLADEGLWWGVDHMRSPEYRKEQPGFQLYHAGKKKSEQMSRGHREADYSSI